MNDAEKLEEPSAYRSLKFIVLDVSNYFTFKILEFTKQCSHHLMGVAKRVLIYVNGTTRQDSLGLRMISGQFCGL